MSKQIFLSAILPSNSRYSLRCIKANEKTENVWCESPEDLANAAASYDSFGYNVYYATAGFGAGDRATVDNAVAKKELYIDVDCGQNKPYPDKAEGLKALRAFCAKTNLPKPTLIDSGNGLHAHWIFDEAVSVFDWIQVAESLKALCEKENFQVDGVCTADVVRVLRVPETTNYKGGNTVTLLTPIRTHPFDKLKNSIGYVFVQPQIKKKKPYELNELTRSLMGNKTSKFEKIWKISKEGQGCEQIIYGIDNAATLSEPQWRGLLSIAEYCEDRDWAIHEISKGYPNYDADETEKKAAGTQGPYTCDTLKGVANSHFCDRCPNKGKITSPIQLGAEFKAKEGPFKVEVQTQDGEVKEYEVPKYPWPFLRGDNGGVYMLGEKDEKGVSKEHLLVPHDLYIYKRSNEESIGDVAWVRYHLPRDGIRDFPISLSEMSSSDKLQTLLASRGVTVFGRGRIKQVQLLFSVQLEALQVQEKADIMHARFGWTDQKSFILGGREYTPDGVRTVPLADYLKRFVRWMTPTGELSKWQAAADMYNNERDDIRAFTVMSGFGSVLMEFISDASAMLNLYSSKGGTGKTTVQYVVNGIWGHPKELIIKASDTPLARIHRMGTMNSLSTCMDEATNMSPQEVSNFAYASTGGTGRNRMDSKVNAERDNQTRWKNICICSSNTSLADKLRLIKNDPQAELSRVIEFNVTTPFNDKPLEKKQVFDDLMFNYGHAGDLFMRYVLANIDEVKKIIKETSEYVYKAAKWTTRERFKIHTLIATIAGGIIAKRLGLINYDIKRILDKVIKIVREEIEHNDNMSSAAIEVFGDFFNKNIGGLLVINDQAAGTMKPSMDHAPKIYTELVLRYEPDTKSLYVAQRPFHKWCADNSINTRELKKRFEEETGGKLTTVRKRMAKGWVTDFGVATAYEIKNAVTLLDLDETKLSDATSTEDTTH